MAQHRTNDQKVADVKYVFDLLRDEVTPPILRQMMAAMTPKDPTNFEQNLAFLQGSFQLARLISANDRAAMIAAAMLTQSGVVKPVFTTEGEVSDG
jgi:hypothetical protein